MPYILVCLLLFFAIITYHITALVWDQSCHGITFCVRNICCMSLSIYLGDMSDTWPVHITVCAPARLKDSDVCLEGSGKTDKWK